MFLPAFGRWQAPRRSTMRFLRCLSALSLILAASAVSSAALAEAPRVSMRTGRFPATEKLATPAALEKAARQLVTSQIPTSSGAELGTVTTTELASGARVVKLPQVYR